MAIDPTQIEAVTFDCYGTLVDWETGIVDALTGLLGAHGVQASRGALLGLYAQFEAECEAGPYESYREVLGRVESMFAAHFGFELDEDQRGVLAASIAEWEAFAETPAALRALGAAYRVGVLSNIDRDLFAGTSRRLGVELDLLVTAEDVRSYKPGRAHFERALMDLGLPASKVLHCAESRRHDIETAGVMGFRTCWVDRARGVASASGEGGGEPDLVVHSLTELLGMLGLRV